MTRVQQRSGRISFLWLTTFVIMVFAPLTTKAQPPLKHDYALINGIKLHSVTSGKGKTILFLHGFPEFWYEWRNLLPAFGERGYQAVAFDMRGYNLSEKPPKVEDYAMSHLIADVKGMLEHVSKGKKAILVAHDWGGAVAWAFAAAHPDMLERLVIINAPHPTVFMRELASNPKQQQASGYMNFFRSPQAEASLSANNYAMLVNVVLNGVQPPGKITEEERKAYIEAWSHPGALTGGLNYYRAAQLGPALAGQKQEETGLSQLKQTAVPVPTLVIWGEGDTALLMGNLDGLDKYVPKLTIRRIPKASHWVIHEQPTLIIQMIEAFAKGDTVPESK